MIKVRVRGGCKLQAKKKVLFYLFMIFAKIAERYLLNTEI